jgi:predicted MPP superfamily phosphohydrolase
VGFLFGLGGLLLVLHVYLWFRLVRSTGSSRRWRLTGGLVLAGLYCVLVASLAFQRWPPSAAWTVVSVVGLGWLAVVVYLALALLAGELLRLAVQAGRRLSRRRDPVAPGGPVVEGNADGPADARRRLLLSRGIAVGAGAVAAATVTWGAATVISGPRVLRAEFALPRLGPALSGYRIALVTDIHLGSINRTAATRRVVDLVNAEQVDLVAVVGDLVDGSVAALGASAAPLADLRSTDGTLFTTGNHEYYSGAPQWEAFLPTLGVTVLRNRSVAIERGGDRLLVAGINDWTGQDHDDPANLAQALADRRPLDAVVLLAHQPRQVAAAAAAGVDLQLSGHTHGGQLWPLHLAVALQQGVVAGAGRVGGTQLWVSRGAGFWGPPVRVGAPPDITVVTLR